MKPYYDDGTCVIYHGDCREVLPALGAVPDLVIADPPYGELSHGWDSWPVGWLEAVAATGTRSMWCFGSARMFDTHHGEFEGWRFSQDVIWDKETAATGGVVDRFVRSHEHIRHYYRGTWSDVHHEAQKVVAPWAVKGRRVNRPATEKAWHGDRNASSWVDDGTRYMLTVLRVDNLVKSALHPTEKPLGVLLPLLLYGCPPGGLVLDPTCGSGSTLRAAKDSGRSSIGIEADERYCEIAASRLAQGALPFGEAG